ncbi:MAG: glucosyltransferase domain-containing protein [Oscillospiraceae bacterium]|nr:glucosyltransferase domain-containing protein [Oscillospiraceae bacterium]
MRDIKVNWLLDLRSRKDLKLARIAIYSALISALLAYYYLIILGNGNPDALCEGLISYTGADWALACGRWAIRYMNMASGDVILPGIWVILYAICCGISGWQLIRLWKIDGKVEACLTACLLTVNPTVIEQSLLQYMFMAWGLSNVLCVLFVYLNGSDSGWMRQYFLAPCCLAVALGLYQACIGIVSLGFCMTLIIRMREQMNWKSAFRCVLRFALSAILGVLLYFIILRLEFRRWGVDESYRVELFSVEGILSSLGESFPNAYRTFFQYFSDHVFHRVYLYVLLAVAGCAAFLIEIAHLFKNRRIVEALAMLTLTLLIPVFANIADIVFPYNTPVLIMQYQSMLVVPFLLALLTGNGEKAGSLRLGRIVCLLALSIITWGYVVSANATYRVYDLSYRHIYFAVSSAMGDVYDLPGYQTDEVVAFAGFPDDSYLRKNVGAYRYAYGQYENFAFWDGMMGLQICRNNYLTHYLGIDGGHIYGKLYNDAVASDEFREMNVWPGENSVKRFDGLIIIKFSENPTIFG